MKHEHDRPSRGVGLKESNWSGGRMNSFADMVLKMAQVIQRWDLMHRLMQDAKLEIARLVYIDAFEQCQCNMDKMNAHSNCELHSSYPNCTPGLY